uniref:Photosystem I assembly protein Ycf4 n=2 Tax=Aegilops tauschii subsp. strangulata TaxID=200361 RepID=A0A453FGS8_AEGTS
MSFYGIAGLFISSYLWCTILWNVGSGYDRFDRKEGIVCIFRWGGVCVPLNYDLNAFMTDRARLSGLTWRESQLHYSGLLS